MFAATNEISHQLQDPLAYLPRRSVVEYSRKQVICDQLHQSTGLSVVVTGRVKVTTTTETGTEIVTGIFYPDELFGAEALVGKHTMHRHKAKAMEATTIMSWTRSDIEEQIERQPALGLALIQTVAAQGRDLAERLQGMALDKAVERLAASLLRFARSGRLGANGAVRISPLTHQFLSEYVSTTREGITLHMKKLRQLGCVQYSREAMEIFPQAITDHFRKQGVSSYQPAGANFELVRGAPGELTA